MKNKKAPDKQDLQKFLEEQAARIAQLEREMEIESALERIRSRSMAMQSPNELAELISVVLKEFQSLGFETGQAAIHLIDVESKTTESWQSSNEKNIPAKSILIPHFDHPFMNEFLNSFKNKKGYVVKIVEGESKKQLDDFLFENTDFKYAPQVMKEAMRARPRLITCNYFNKHGSIEVISDIPLEEGNVEILKRFSNVFEQTYTRFLDLQKAESQAKEAQIEAALERVRSASMAMHHTSELQNVINTVSQQFKELDIDNSGGVFISINDEIKDKICVWGAGETASYVQKVEVPFLNRPINTNIVEKIKKGPGFFTEEFSYKAKIEFLKHLFKNPPYNATSKEHQKQRLSIPGGYTRSCTVNEHTSVFMINHHGRVFSESENKILKRFGKVFEQSYTRFLDLQKAEAQAREAQIEAALERVRARTMAMQKSDELPEVVHVMYEQLKPLEIGSSGIELILGNEQTGNLEFWDASIAQSLIPRKHAIPRDGHPFFKRQWKAWKRQDNRLVITLKGKKKREFDDYIFSETEFKHLPKEVIDFIRSTKVDVFSHAIMKYGLFESVDSKPLSEEKFQLLERFAHVFEQTYTRFLDLQKAEAQTREAQIEAALERVRSKSMAMHKSEELSETAEVLFEQINLLGKIPDRISIGIINEESKNVEFWVTDQSGNQLSHEFFFSLDEPTSIVKIYNAWKERKDSIVVDLTGQKLQNWLLFVKENAKLPINETKIIGRRVQQAAFFSQGFLLLTTHEPVADEIMNLLVRFAKVFDQTYTRFIDLQKAEAQAREAQIEAALERVRSRTMAMHSSDELAAAAVVLFDQLRSLGGDLWSCGFVFCEKNNPIDEQWMSVPEAGLLPPQYIPHEEEPVHYNMFKAWEKGEELYTETVEGEAGKRIVSFLMAQPTVRKNFEKLIEAGFKAPEWQKLHAAFFSKGYLLIITTSEYPETHIFKRFANVFEQTYTRFLDLQKAEAQAREAQIEAAIERVRAASMAMHKSEDLINVSTILYDEFHKLGATQFGSTGFVLIDEENQVQRLWGSKTESKLLDFFTLPLFGDQVFQDRYNAWKNKVPVYSTKLNKEELKKHMEIAAPDSNISKREKEAKAAMPDPTYFYFGNFKQGYLQIITGEAISEEHQSILVRFAKAFEQTYTRFLDLQKAEAQAHEAQIETALERVRAATMAMHKSDELHKVVQTVSKEISELGLNIDATHLYRFDNEDSKDLNFWVAAGEYTYPFEIHWPYIDLEFFNLIHRTRKNKEAFFSLKQDKQTKNQLLNHLLDHSIFEIPKDRKEFILNAENAVGSMALFKRSGILIFRYTDEAFNEQENDILNRFAKVFEQAYVRFLDLQKAEGQAREALIEGALERIRARANGMHHSNELEELNAMVFEELSTFDISMMNSMIWIFDQENLSQRVWLTNPIADGTLNSYLLPYHQHPPYLAMIEGWRNKEKEWIYDLKGEIKRSWDQFLFHETDYANLPSEAIKAMRTPEHVILLATFNDFGALALAVEESLSDEQMDVLIRFGRVFDQSYTRFLDLQKAEAQAREAQIEAVMERIRAQALAMHSSDDIMNVTRVLREQLGNLGKVELESTIVHIYKDSKDKFSTWWSFKPLDPTEDVKYGMTDIHKSNTAWARETFKHYDSDQTSYTIESRGDMLQEWYRELEVIEPQVVDYDEKGELIIPEVLYYHFAKFSGGALLSITNDPPNEETTDVQQRAANVFNLAYLRFLDLQNAEAQAREAHVETVMERIRAQAMAMHNSDDIMNVTKVLREQLGNLGKAELESTIVHIYKEPFEEFSAWWAYKPADPDAEIIYGAVDVPVANTAWARETLSLYKSNQNTYTIESRGNMIKEWYDQLEIIAPEVLDYDEKGAKVIPEFLFYTFAKFSGGALLTITNDPPKKETIEVQQRAANVFNLAYLRFLDLQKAEAQAKEAKIEAALERLRASAMAMHASSELAEISTLLFGQLQELGVKTSRAGFAIIGPEAEYIEIWSTVRNVDGEAQLLSGLIYEDTHPMYNDFVESWRKKETFIKRELHGEELKNYYLKLSKTLDLPEEVVSVLNESSSEFYNLYHYEHGFVYAFSGEAFTEEEDYVMTRFAQVFDLTYRRFLDLQTAEAQARKIQEEKTRLEQTLNNLKATQAQLIQSEKMASLGELTAGIAHEIQNPLNFVNNFSEVSKELLIEMKEELEAGSKEDALEIISDLILNLEKINHHGGRASGIVKGMLDHSRASSIQAEPTNINELCDEYLRLAYHGLRAKDRSFNANYETDFDDTIPLLNIVPQEIGRVILNLINNAFYVVNEKSKETLNGYSPTVTISTYSIPDEKKMAIKVMDNGKGIPRNIIPKIFQPFFTTKPTGKGTGLGLSLSYDIVKAHGGELTVESTENSGSEFIIKLPFISKDN